MVRLLVCAGLHLDAAWPELGPEVGRGRRELAAQLLVEVVRSARDEAADAIAVVGGLSDGQTVLPSTLTMVATAFSSFDGQVLIVPGAVDPYGPDAPYALADWPDNTRVLSDPDQIVEFGSGIQAVGVPATSTHGRPSRHAEAPIVLLGGGIHLTPDWLREEGYGTGASVIAGGRDSEVSGSIVTVGQLLAPRGLPTSGAVIVEFDEAGVASTQQAAPEGRPIDVLPLDISDIESTEDLRTTVKRHVEAARPGAVIRLTGTLQRGILLPGFVDGDEIDPAALDLSVLTYALDEPDAEVIGSRSEFESAVVRDEGPDRVRHQAIALGLQGLAAPEA